MPLHELEELHQLVLLRQRQAPVLKNRAPRIRHALQFAPGAAHETRIHTLELHVLIDPGVQYQIDHRIGTEEYAWRHQIEAKLSGVIERLGRVGIDFEFGVERASGERDGRGGIVGALVRRLRWRFGMGSEEGDEVVERERSGVRTVERIGIEVEDGLPGGGRGGGDDGFWQARADYD